MRRIETRRAQRLGGQDARDLRDGLFQVVVDDHVVVVLGGGELAARVGQALGHGLDRVATMGQAGLQRVERRRGDEHLRGLGHLLISIRIAQGMSQRELARRLDVHESQVSRDERNEYFGITLERAIKVLDALNVRLHTKVEIEPQREMAYA